MSKYNYTVIIPHKNIPDLLQRCLNSLPDRDDLQVIVVDDNSDPKKVDFDHFPGLNRKNTKVFFDKSGKGAGRARNIGLDNVEDTKWLFFADSDDFYNPILSEKMDHYLNSGVDIIYFGVDSVYSETLEPSIRKNRYNNHFVKAIESGDEYELRCKLTVPWSKFIRYEVPKKGGFRFTEIPASNDAYFSLLCAFAAKSIATDTDEVYTVTDRKNSITSKPSFENWRARFDEMKRVNALFKKEGKLEYHPNMFAQTYYLAKYKPVALFKYIPEMFWYTPIKYWVKDINACVKSIRGKEEYK